MAFCLFDQLSAGQPKSAGKRLAGCLLGLLLALATGAASSAEVRARVINGDNAKTGDWPWIAALVSPGESSVFNGQFCAAALIAPTWVITAAHCLVEESYFGPLVQLPDVIVGINDLDSNQGYRVTSRRAIVHPEFDSVELYNDIALLELSEPVPAQTINIPGPIYNAVFAEPDMVATALGWGATSSDGYFFPSILQQVELPLIDNQTCNWAIGPGIGDGVVCAGDGLGTADTCSGDSGGPLVTRSGLHGDWTLIGLTSYGIGQLCAQPGTYGAYTRVAYYSQWISDTLCTPKELPTAPAIDVRVDGTHASVSFPEVPGASGYHLYHAPADDLDPIAQIDMLDSRYIEADLPRGTDIKVAVHPYTHMCQGSFSTIERISIP